MATLARVSYCKATNERELAALLESFQAGRFGNIMIDVLLTKDEKLFPKASAYFDDGKQHSMPGRHDSIVTYGRAQAIRVHNR